MTRPLVRLIATFALVVAFWAVPREALAALPAICLFKRFAGIECYGCGMTRAIHAFVHGDVAAAVAYNLLVLPLAAAVLSLAAIDGVRLARAPRRRSSRHGA
jgi:hypothetical protein